MQFVSRLCALVVAVSWIGTGGMPGQVNAGEVCTGDLDFVSEWDQDSGSYADIWAEGDTVYVAQFGDNKVHFIDISDPNTPDRFLEWAVASPNMFASAQDVKVGDGLLFIGLSGEGGDSVEVVDVRDPFNPQHVTWIRISGYTSVHNTFYRDGFLYLANSFTPEIVVVDLTALDPDNPPFRIETSAWRFNAGNVFVHDVTVKNGRLYAAAWDSGLYVYDVTNVANATPAFLGSAAGDNTHAMWSSDDGRWVVAGEEREGGPIRLYELIDNGGGLDVVLRDTVQQSLSESTSAHNIVIDGLRVYVSWYQAGVLIYDINPDLGVLEFVSQFDTYSGSVGGFDGCWGVYPLLGEDRIVASDMASGLFVLKTTPTALRIAYPDGLVSVVDPMSGATLVVELVPECGVPDASTARVFVSTDGDGGVFEEIPLVPVGGDLYEASLPGAACGSDVRYYVTVDSLEGESFFDPPTAPAVTHGAVVISTTELLFFDDFEDDLGWLATSDQCVGEDDTGFWERVDPNGTGAAPEDDYPEGDGTRCFVTEQGEVGGGNGSADVDGGPFWLTSPEIALNGLDAAISYARWFANNDNDEDEDFLTVELSVDGGVWQTVEIVSSGGPQWDTHAFLLSEISAPGDTMQLRFSTFDCPNNSLTEAAIDEVLVQYIECVDSDTVAPFIIHDEGMSTVPHSGYIDPRRESTNGTDLDLGVSELTILFSEMVQKVGGGSLDGGDFEVVTSGDSEISVASVDDAQNPVVVVTLESPVPAGEWLTLIAHVEDLAGNAIVTSGDLGEDTDEPDRIDLAGLPCDVDQSGTVQAIDLLRFRQMFAGTLIPDIGEIEDFIDMDRNGAIQALDLLRFRQLWFGSGTSTQPWQGETLATRP